MKQLSDTTKKSRITQITIFLGFLGLYLLLPSRNYLYADDSLGWAYGLIQQNGIINTHHLFLNVLRFFYHALPESLNLAPERFIAIYVSLWVAAGLLSLYNLFNFLNCKDSALPRTLVCGFTIGYWSYSIVGDVYVPATATLVLGSYTFLKWIEIRNPNFSIQRSSFLSYMQSLDQDRVVWVPLKASSPEYFLLQSP